MDIISKIIDKLFSGKFALLVMVGFTYSILLYCCVWLVFKGKIEGKELIGLIGGVSAILVMLWKDYCHTNGDSVKSPEIKQPEAKTDAKSPTP